MGILETASTLMGCEKPLCRASGAIPCCPEPPGVSLECWVVYSKEDLTSGAHHTVSIVAGDHRRGDEGQLVPPNKDVSAGSQDFLPLSLRSWFWFPNDLRFVKTGK